MDATTKVTGREAQRLATRERVFEVAVAEFRQTGVSAADVNAIAKEAGVAHGTFFFHFPTKEHVLAELGQREEVRLAGQLERFLDRQRGLRETLHEVLRLTKSLERRLGSVLFDDLISLYFSPRRPELRLWPDHPFITRVVAEFEHARDQKEIPADPDVEPSNVAIFFFMGLFALLVTYERGAARDAVLEQSVSALLSGLGAR